MSILFNPLLPIWAIWLLGGMTLLCLSFAVWRGLAGWALRALAGIALLVALCGPMWQEEERESLSDIVLLLVDESDSQKLGNRAAQTEEALARLTRQITALPNTELRIQHFEGGEAGSLAMTAINQALAAEPRARVAGVILLSDGRAHDMGLVPDLPAPLHLLLTGEQSDWDRRLVIENAPAFAIIGEEFSLKLRIEDQGQAPFAQEVDLTITVDAEAPQTYRVPIGVELEMPLVLPHAGMNVLQFSIPEAEGELTPRNNQALVQINGVRDRLRVLLVSGEPHAGERVWRNLLKSDASVDLVHFTILRPPEKSDGVPVEELSLIAFPTRELFVEKIREFDLIIFDRYRMRGILPMSYIQNIVDYVTEGGTVLVASGPEFGAVDSLYRTPLADILPVAPTAQVIEGPFYPKITDLGRRHPVTEGLDSYAPAREDGAPPWGKWLRAIEVEKLSGQTVMEGPQGLPLLVLDRVGQGRIAALNSDHAWLWGRGYDGGGPQLELLRRLAHWMLKEPELEEETLTAALKGEVLTITRRSLAQVPPPPLTIIRPNGEVQNYPMEQVSEGEYRLIYTAPEQGLYRLTQGDLTRVIGVGPAAPKEFEETIASGEAFADVFAPALFSAKPLEEGLPNLRLVEEGRPISGRGWIGLTPREAYVTSQLRQAPILPNWAWGLIVGALAVLAWLIEGRRGRLFLQKQ